MRFERIQFSTERHETEVARATTLLVTSPETSATVSEADLFATGNPPCPRLARMNTENIPENRQVTKKRFP